MGELVNKQRLQTILGRDHKTLLKWQKEGMPVEKQGKRGESSSYDTEKVIDWLIKRANDTDSELERARIRSINAQADKTEIEVETMRGNLIPLEAMHGMWSDVLAAFRARILSIPSRLTPQLASIRDPKKIERLLKETHNEALQELADYDPRAEQKSKVGGKSSHKHRSSSAASKPD
jgi:phage terminase Nu1 subunit (DNA packaging protein)